MKSVAVSVALLAPSAAISDSIQNYFTTDAYQCGRNTYIAEWSVIGDTNSDTVTIQRFLRREDRDRSSFEGLTWQFSAADLSNAVAASGANGRPLLEFSGMLSGSPKVINVDRSGEPRDDCVFNLKVAQNPSERFTAMIAALNVTEPSASDGVLVNNLLAYLPPAAMLPTLSQASTESEVQNAIRPFWDRYKATVLARAVNIEDLDVLSETAQLWIEQNTNHRSRFHGDLLLEAQSLRAKAIQQQGEEPSRLAVTETDALCTRIDGFNVHWDWNDYLELATGLPLEYWNDTLAEEFLSSSETCEDAGVFRNEISRRWPDVQARIAAFNEVLVERDRIAALDINLESIVAENWLSIDRDRLSGWRRLGMSQDDVMDIISPALEAQKQVAIERLPDALADEARAQTIELDDFNSWCDQRRHEMGYAYNSDLQGEIFEGCHVELAALLRKQALEAIEAHKTTLLDAPQDIATLIATDGYSFENVIPRLSVRNPAFEPAVTDIHAALAAAQSATEARYETVLAAAMEDMSTAFANAEPTEEGAAAANEMCVPFTGFGTPQRLRPIGALCQNLMNGLRLRRQEAECDLIWTNMKSPEGIQRGYLNVPQLLGEPRPVNVRELVCDSTRAGVNVWITEDGGWFSSNFRLHREAKIQAQTVEISVRLNTPEAGTAEWTVDDPTISSGALGLNDAAVSEEIMGCFYYPETCYRP